MTRITVEELAAAGWRQDNSWGRGRRAYRLNVRHPIVLGVRFRAGDDFMASLMVAGRGVWLPNVQTMEQLEQLSRLLAYEQRGEPKKVDDCCCFDNAGDNELCPDHGGS